VLTRRQAGCKIVSRSETKLLKEERMVKCTKCKSENVKLEDVQNKGKGRMQNVVCLDCGFYKGPKVFSRQTSTCNECPNPRVEETCGNCNDKESNC